MVGVNILKLVLKELETLSRGIAGLNEEIQALKSDITELRSREDKVEELRAWKQRCDEIASPTQMKMPGFVRLKAPKNFQNKSSYCFPRRSRTDGCCFSIK
jgi:chromosome segregation ATPase